MDNLSLEQRRRNMQSIKSQGTKIEDVLHRHLLQSGVRMTRNSKFILGKPDFSLKKHKIAVFCDGEFWHGKSFKKISGRIMTNKTYWIKKIEGNIARDKFVTKELKKDGWSVIRFWEGDLLRNPHGCVNKILRKLEILKGC